MADTAPIYPEVEARKHLSKKQKAEIVLRQNGRCAGCGIKPKAWEFDHGKALWKGDTKQASLDEWQAFGSRKDCDCHQRKTSAEAGERAKMNRLRGKAGQVKRRKERGSLLKSRNSLSLNPRGAANFGGLKSRGFDKTKTRKFSGKVVPR